MAIAARTGAQGTRSTTASWNGWTVPAHSAGDTLVLVIHTQAGSALAPSTTSEGWTIGPYGGEETYYTGQLIAYAETVASSATAAPDISFGTSCQLAYHIAPFYDDGAASLTYDEAAGASWALDASADTAATIPTATAAENVSLSVYGCQSDGLTNVSTHAPPAGYTEIGTDQQLPTGLRKGSMGWAEVSSGSTGSLIVTLGHNKTNGGIHAIFGPGAGGGGAGINMLLLGVG